jgi:tetratricopeptide (TPR) repeat protein
MVNISLRDYYKEIISLITNGQHLLAVDHCLHILATYPKDIETYRILGRAFLEANDHAQAADIFERILAIRPDDYVANVGMSVIREEEGNLGAAIWHMERAFELDTSTTAVQVELKRLYTIRDGETPQKIRLTKGALIRMYVNGGMLQQAISEILAKFPSLDNRPDLQTLLANLYYQTNQKAAAVDLCKNILQNLPYCFDANLILFNLASSPGGMGEPESYRNRIIETNPYYAFVQDFSIDVDTVPDDAVMLPGFEPTADNIATETDSLPVWFSDEPLATEKPESLKIEEAPQFLEENLPSEDMPDQGLLDTGVGTDSPPAELSQDHSEVALPDWMNESGWKKEVPDLEIASSELETPPDADTFPADIPEWIKDMAPLDSVPDQEPLLETGEQIDIMQPLFPDQELAGASSNIDDESSQSIQPVIPITPIFLPESHEDSLAVPEWLQGFDPSHQRIPKDFDKSLPDWLDAQEPDAIIPENKPFTLEDISPIQPESYEAPFPDELSGTAPLSPESLASIEKPEWLKESQENSELNSLFSPSEKTEQPDEEMTEWLNKFRLESSPEALQDGKSEETQAELPAWLMDPQSDQKDGDTEPVPVNQTFEQAQTDGWIPEHTQSEPVSPFSFDSEAEIPDISALFDEMPDHQRTMSEFAQDAGKMPAEIFSFDEGGMSVADKPDNNLSGMENITSLIDFYGQKIQTTADLPSVITEIKTLTGEYPEEPGIWLVLGDAYHKNRQIQAALDAYARAEEFLSK